MGILGLTKAIEALKKTVQIGCLIEHEHTHICSHSAWLVLIDGPSLVYYIYRKRYAQNLANGAIGSLDAQPSYHEVITATVQYLNKLSSLGESMVFWDGVLPEEKHPVRISRLRSVVANLALLRKAEPKGLVHRTHVPTRGAGGSRDTSFGFGVDSQYRTSSLLPPLPFMVPACFEIHSKSEKIATKESRPGNDRLQEQLHDEITWIRVSGEADPWLAAYARLDHERSGQQSTSSRKILILSDDSDLAVHQLNDAYLVVFSALEFKDECTAYAHAFHQASILKSFENKTQPEDKAYEGWLKATFLFDNQQKITNKSPNFMTLLKPDRIKTLQGKLDTDLHLSNDFRAFREEHAARIDLDADTLRALNETQGPIVDVRLSELKAQLEHSRNELGNSARIYLPPLLDDPDRTTAWAASQDIRTLAYAVLAKGVGSLQMSVDEYSRSGHGVNYKSIQLTHGSQLQSSLSTWTRYLSRAHQLCREVVSDNKFLASGDLRTWMTLTICECYNWLSQTGKQKYALDSIRSIIKYQPAGSQGVRRLRWPNIHLLAMIQAYLYSLRMLKQSLEVQFRHQKSVAETELSPDKCFLLFPALHDLPRLDSLMRAPYTVPDLSLTADDVVQVSQKLQSLARECGLEPYNSEGGADALTSDSDVDTNQGPAGAKNCIETAESTEDSMQEDDDSLTFFGSRFAVLTPQR